MTRTPRRRPHAAVGPLSLALLLLSASTGAEPPAAPPAGTRPTPATDAPLALRLSAYAGRWEFRSEPSADADRLASIETATRELSWIVRRMANGVLRRTTRPPNQLAFSWDGQRLHQVVGPDPGAPPARPIRLDAEPRSWIAANGQETLTRWSWTDAGLRVDWEQSQAIGSNTYRVTPDGQSLLVEHRIQVTAIEAVAPILYRSWFRRESGVPSGSAPQDG